MVSFIFIACKHHPQTAQKLLVKLQTMITSGNSELLNCLPHINAPLTKLIYTCDGVRKMETTTAPSFEDKEKFAPGKKMNLQPRFITTSTIPGRKQRKNMLQYVSSVNCAHAYIIFIPMQSLYDMYLTNSFSKVAYIARCFVKF